MLGFLSPAKAAKRRVRSLAKLHLELAKLEAKEKATALAIGAGLAGFALLLALYAVGFGFAAAAVGLMELVPLWAALLIVAGALLLCAAVAVYMARRYFRELSHPLPEEAIKEMETTIESLKAHA
jgi:membrane protein implicated in regulation of membrane protease activity